MLKVDGERSFEVLESLVHESTHADEIHLLKIRGKAQSDHQIVSEDKKELAPKDLNGKDVLVMKWEQDQYMDGVQSVDQTDDEKLYEMFWKRMQRLGAQNF